MTVAQLHDQRKPPWVREVTRRQLVGALTSAFAIGGYACTIVFLIVGFSNGQWVIPGGDVAVFYAPAGDALRSGGEVYAPGFLYGPPVAVAFAAVSWLGPTAMHAIILGLDAVALWTIAWGNWKRLGYILWIPLVPFDIAAGQLNLVVAAAIVAAQHGIVWPLAAVTFAKVWPAIALPLRYWRPFLIALAAFALVSLPWLTCGRSGSRRSSRRSVIHSVPSYPCPGSPGRYSRPGSCASPGRGHAPWQLPSSARASTGGSSWCSWRRSASGSRGATFQTSRLE